MEADQMYFFGPSFFTHHLLGFIHERCPEASDRLPILEIHLRDGNILCVCHIILLTPKWLALAVREHGEKKAPMSTELIPYDSIARLTIRTAHAAETRVGFNAQHSIPIMGESVPASPEAALYLAAQRPE